MYAKSEACKESRLTSRNKEDMIFYIKYEGTSTFSPLMYRVNNSHEVTNAPLN